MEEKDDAISRQTVLDATVKKNSIWNKITNSKGENLEEIISQLPPVKPQEPCEDMGEVSDGYHTFNQLYHQRAILFATIVNQNKDKAWKSYKHSDGKYCFDSNGEWFIVGVNTPEGSYTYHYSKEYWDYFDCKELDCGKEWDGHTEEDVTRLLSLGQEPKTGQWILVDEESNTWKCTNCIKEGKDDWWQLNHGTPQDNKMDYCPHCGAKMTESEDGIFWAKETD